MYLQSKKYQSFCDTVFDPDNKEPPASGSVYVLMENIDQFFLTCKKTDNRYVVVSADSDYGVAHQQEHPVWLDLRKWMESLLYMGQEMIDFKSFGYDALTIPPRCFVERCNIDDKYSIKCSSHTASTFPQIPSNVHKWFATNCMIKHPCLECLPFGMHEGVEETLSSITPPEEKNKWLYVNFETYTLNRYFLKKYLHSIFNENIGWMTLVLQASKPLKEYLTDIAQHKFTLCPNGNGVDCFRTWEALYLGSIPIVEKNVTSSYFDDLPIVAVDNIHNIDLKFLEKKYDEIKSKEWNMDKLDMTNWKHKIKDTLNEINY